MNELCVGRRWEIRMDVWCSGAGPLHVMNTSTHSSSPWLCELRRNGSSTLVLLWSDTAACLRVHVSMYQPIEGVEGFASRS